MTTKDFQTKSPLRIFLSYFKRHRKLFAIDMGCAVLISMGELGISALMRQLVDVCTSGDMDSLRQAAVLGMALMTGDTYFRSLYNVSQEA